MTLVIAVRGQDFVVLGADRRGTVQDSGDNTVSLNIFDKLIPINNRVAALMHGSAPAMRFLLEEVQATSGIADLGVTAVARRLVTSCRKELRDIPIAARAATPQFGIVVCGLDHKGRKWTPRCLGLSSYAGFWLESHSPFGIFGRPMIANYLFEKHYKTDSSEKHLAWLVALALTETRRVDGFVGGNIQMVVIRKSGISDFDEDDVMGMIEEGEPTAPVQVIQ